MSYFEEKKISCEVFFEKVVSTIPANASNMLSVRIANQYVL